MRYLMPMAIFTTSHEQKNGFQMQSSPCGPLIWHTSSDNSRTTKSHYQSSTLPNAHSSSSLTCLLVATRAGTLPTTRAQLASMLRTPRRSSIARYPIYKDVPFSMTLTCCALSCLESCAPPVDNGTIFTLRQQTAQTNTLPRCCLL